MQARELPRGNAPASPFETRRFAAFLRVRGKFVRADIDEGTGVYTQLSTTIHSPE
jgi:hypothetical protein